MSGEQDPIMQYFAYQHLRNDLQPVSKVFGDVAEWVVTVLPASAERAVALRKLLEAKDAAVRAALVEVVREEPVGREGV